MKLNKSKIICALVFWFCASNVNAQFICNLGNKDNIIGNSSEYEYSALAYHPTLELFFLALDDPIDSNPDTYIRGYNPNYNEDFDVALIGNYNNPDFEGLTYLEEDYFALIDESSRRLYFLEYDNDFQNPKFTIINTQFLANIQLNDGDGLEGLTYHSDINTLYAVRETDYRLYSIPIELSNNSLTVKQNEITNVQLPASLFGGGCASGIYHLSKNYSTNHPLANNILVISHELSKVFEFELTLGVDNKLTSNSLDFISEATLNQQPQAEGIVVVDSHIYIASEELGGGLSRYAVKSVNDNCDDGDPNTINDMFDEFCNCTGTAEPACKAVAFVPLNANNQTTLANEYVSSQSIFTNTGNDLAKPIDVIVRATEELSLKSCAINLQEGFVVEAGAALNITIDPCQ